MGVGTSTIADLSTRVTVQVRTMAADEYGQPVPTWTTVRTVWAKVEFLSGTKVFGEPPESTHAVVLRHFDGLTTQHRLLIGGVPYYIVSLGGDGVFHDLIVNTKEV